MINVNLNNEVCSKGPNTTPTALQVYKTSLFRSENKNAVEIIVFWGVTPCCLVDRYWPFGGRASSIFAVLLCSYTTLVPTWRLITERCVFVRPTQCCYELTSVWRLLALWENYLLLTQFTSTSYLAHLKGKLILLSFRLTTFMLS